MSKELSRRGFLSTAAVITAGATVAGLSGCAKAPEPVKEKPFWLPEKWHSEADFVIVGFGGAGAAACVTAVRNGASAIALEKDPELRGGNSGCCVGGMLCVEPGKEAEARIFMKELAGVSVSAAEIDQFIKESTQHYDWMKSLESDYTFNVTGPGKVNPLMPTLPGNESVTMVGRYGSGKMAWESLMKTLDVEDKDGLITVHGGTTAKKLIQNPVTKEIIGVYAELPDGTTAAFKAKKAVLMTLGGFENNFEMFGDYIYDACARFRTFPWGSPYHTGDGIGMLAEVGGKLRHMCSIEWGSPQIIKASEEVGVAVCLGSSRWPYLNAILVNRTGKRFCNEITHGATVSTTAPTHYKQHFAHIDFDMILNDLPNLPFYLITDHTRISSGVALADKVDEKNLVETWAAVHGLVAWSSDNQKEIAKGWIIKADTLEELASKMGIDGPNLVAQVAEWNAMVAAGKDTQFGRTQQFTPVNNPPYYGVELGMSVINTQGGAHRDERHRCLDWNEKPIPRLYAAGEFGSIFGFLYYGGGNLPEAIHGGKAALEFALDETDWDV